VIRFIIEDDREIDWHDTVRGTVTWQGSDLGGDMVIARAGETNAIGQPLYNLAVVVDDIDMEITHVIRGEDHIANTAKQILLYEALGADIPEFAHTPLILNQDGRKLSKRDGVTSIDDFRKMGFLPQALANYMTLLGWTPPDSTEEIFTLETAATKFELERVNKAGAKFDWDKLDWLNSQYLHQMPANELVELLIPYWQTAGYNVDRISDRDWLEKLTAMIAPSLTRLSDVIEPSLVLKNFSESTAESLQAIMQETKMSQEIRVFFVDSIDYSAETLEFLKQEGVAAVLQEVIASLEVAKTLDETNAQDIIKQIIKNQKVKKGLVMRSLRAGLTGEMHGPDLIQSWLLLNQKQLDKGRLTQALNLI
jgi:glutamyl-tRNA synthetase